MQQDLNELSHNSINQRVQNTSQTRNHGEDDQDHFLSHQLSAGEREQEPRPSAGARAGSDASSNNSEDGLETSLRGLSIPRGKTGSPVDKIFEHERASVQSHKKKRGGPAFTVISRARKPGGPDGSITDLPNGTAQPLCLKSKPLMKCRGPYSCIISPTSRVSVPRIPRFKAISRAGHHATRLENSLLSLFPRG